MKIIDGKNAMLGRLASYAAKESLKGEEIVIVNCNDILISGNKKSIKENFLRKRSMVGYGQRGPKHHRASEKIIKRTIRGMIPNYREGRGREAWKRIKCYDNVPKEYEESKKILLEKTAKKFSKVSEFN